MRKYVVDETGRKKAVIIDLEEYNRLIEYLEDIEDALDLKDAISRGGEFVELREFKEQMKREGKI